MTAPSGPAMPMTSSNEWYRVGGPGRAGRRRRVGRQVAGRVERGRRQVLRLERRGDAELHDPRQRAGRVDHRGRERRLVVEQDRLAGERAEVDDDVVALAGGDHQSFGWSNGVGRSRRRCRSRASAAAPGEAARLPSRGCEAGVAAVDDPEPVEPWLDLQERLDRPVDAHRVPEELGDPGRRRVEQVERRPMALGGNIRSWMTSGTS